MIGAIAPAIGPEKDDKPSSDCEHSSDDIICAECRAYGHRGRGSKDERIADNEGELRERKSEGAPTNQLGAAMDPRLLPGFHTTCHTDKKSDSPDSDCLETKDRSA